MLQISINILLVFHVFVSVLMLLVVLMQRPKSEGLGAAFGGGMTENIFGAQTTTVLTKFTVYLGCAFFALTLMLAILFAKQSSRESRLADQLLVEEAEVITPDAAMDLVAPSPVEAPQAEATPEVLFTPPVEADTGQTEPENTLFEAPAIETPSFDTTLEFEPSPAAP